MPTRRDLLSVSAILPMAACAKAASPASPTPYTVYEPSMARYVAVAASRSYPYNHASSIIGYQGWYFLLWNASGSIEGADGQVILMKRSATLDGLAAAPMEPCFPAIPARTAAQWQPGTCVVGDELWALWSQSGREGVGTYFSRLKSRGGSFETERLQASTLDRDGIHYDSAFITGDIIPLTLPNGQTRHLAPVVYQSSAAVTPSALMPNASMGRFAARRKLAGVLYNDGAGVEVPSTRGSAAIKNRWSDLGARPPLRRVQWEGLEVTERLGYGFARTYDRAERSHNERFHRAWG